MNSAGQGNRGAASAKGDAPRRKKVAAVQRRVKAGRYRVAAEKVAEKMIDDAVRAIRGRCRGQ